MRDIRSRIAERTGVDLTTQQIQELAARRLEAILDPRGIKPGLLDELRRASGISVDATQQEQRPAAGFDPTSLYKSSNGLLRFIRRLLNPLLRLMFDPDAIARAFNAQSEQLRAAATREAEQRRRQVEWNALHYELLRRVVLDVARTEIDAQGLNQRIESLGAKVEFNERRVRTIEQANLARPARPQESSPGSPPPQGPREDTASQGQGHASPDGSAEGGGRRRRRRRRGRRPGGGPMMEGVVPSGAGSASEPTSDLIDEPEDTAEETGGPDEGGEEIAVESQPAPVDSPPEPTPMESPVVAPDPQPAPTPAEPEQRLTIEPTPGPVDPEPNPRSDS